MTHAIRKMQRLAKRRHEILAQHQTAIEEAQRTCSHTSVLEAHFKAGVLFDKVPRRVCQACGLIEEGWTFRVLHNPLFTVAQHLIDNTSHHITYGSPGT